MKRRSLFQSILAIFLGSKMVKILPPGLWIRNDITGHISPHPLGGGFRDKNKELSYDSLKEALDEYRRIKNGKS